MKLRISLLIILMSMLFTSCGISTGKGTEQKEEEISVLRYDKLLSEYVRSNSFSAMQKLTMDYRMPTKILIEDVLSIGTVKDDTISQRLQKYSHGLNPVSPVPGLYLRHRHNLRHRASPA